MYALCKYHQGGPIRACTRHRHNHAGYWKPRDMLLDWDADQNIGARYLRCRLVTAGWPPHRAEHLIGIPKEVHKRRLRQGSFELGSLVCGNTIRTLEQHTMLANILQRQTEFQKPTAEERATV